MKTTLHSFQHTLLSKKTSNSVILLPPSSRSAVKRSGEMLCNAKEIRVQISLSRSLQGHAAFSTRKSSKLQKVSIDK